MEVGFCNEEQALFMLLTKLTGVVISQVVEQQDEEEEEEVLGLASKTVVVADDTAFRLFSMASTSGPDEEVLTKEACLIRSVKLGIS